MKPLYRTVVLVLFAGLAAGGGAGAATAAAAAETAPEPGAVLRELARSYYAFDRAGLARASAYVRSQDILDQFDATARTILDGPDYECVVVPGKPVQVRAVDIPSGADAGARLGVTAYAAAAQAVLNAVFQGLQGIGDLLDPTRLEGVLDLRLEVVPGPGRKSVRRLVWSARDTTGLGDGPGREELALTLDLDGRPATLRRRTDTGSEEVAIATQVWGAQWGIRELDVTRLDAAGRLTERTVIALDYVTQKGLHLPARIAFKAVDRDGRLVHRRNQANPVTIRFSQYRVERRQ